VRVLSTNCMKLLYLQRNGFGKFNALGSGYSSFPTLPSGTVYHVLSRCKNNGVFMQYYLSKFRVPFAQYFSTSRFFLDNAEAASGKEKEPPLKQPFYLACFLQQAGISNDHITKYVKILREHGIVDAKNLSRITGEALLARWGIKNSVNRSKILFAAQPLLRQTTFDNEVRFLSEEDKVTSDTSIEMSVDHRPNPLPFVDRDRDVIRIVADQINNAIRSRLLYGENSKPQKENDPQRIGLASSNLRSSLSLESSQNNWKEFVLDLGAQMLGCGKTYLGRSLQTRAQIKEIKEEVKKQLIEGYQEEDYDRFINAKYIHIHLCERRSASNDTYGYRGEESSSSFLRTDIFSFEYALKLALIQQLLLKTGNLEEDREFFVARRIKETTTGDIIRYFSEKYRCAFFVHLDDIDGISTSEYTDLATLEPSSLSSSSDLDRFTYLWTLLQPMITHGGYLYCSGRSSMLYQIANGMHSLRSVFPGQCVW